MITEIKGNLLNSEANLIIHCTNCFHTMGGGIALAIKNKYKEAYEADLETEYGSEDKLGTFSVSRRTEDNKFIFNLYGQYEFGGLRPLNYEAFYSGLEATKISIDNKNFELTEMNPVIGFPARIGSALAGGNWKVVREMIYAVYDSSKHPVVIVDFEA